jgi:hypothetical protein
MPARTRLPRRDVDARAAPARRGIPRSCRCTTSARFAVVCSSRWRSWVTSSSRRTTSATSNRSAGSTPMRSRRCTNRWASCSDPPHRASLLGCTNCAARHARRAASLSGRCAAVIEEAISCQAESWAVVSHAGESIRHGGSVRHVGALEWSDFAQFPKPAVGVSPPEARDPRVARAVKFIASS